MRQNFQQIFQFKKKKKLDHDPAIILRMVINSGRF